MNIITKEGYPYGFDPKGCDTCKGNCCIGESGNIWISSQEISKLASLLKISIDEVRENYLEKRGYKFSIKEVKLAEDNFACVFFDLEKKGCSIYEARPIQCRTFPFWDYFKTRENEVKEECPAIINL